MLRYMQYVYTIYKEKSFTRAAERLYISQPSLSATIKKLETELGFPIFERGGKEITPTCIGEKYIKAIEEILMIQNDLENEIDDLLKLRKGNIILGSTSCIVSNVLPDILKDFRQKYFGIAIKILVEQSTVLQEKLEKGLVDIVLDNATTTHPDIAYIPLLKERILIGVPRGFEINRSFKAFQIPADKITNGFLDYGGLPKMDISAFRGEEFILLNSGNKMRQIARKIFAERNITPKVSFEFDQLTTAMSFAENGFGICFLTDTILKYGNACKNITLYQPDTEFADRTLYIMYKKSRYLSSASHALITFLKQEKARSVSNL